jgi:hypothetical protein
MDGREREGQHRAARVGDEAAAEVVGTVAYEEGRDGEQVKDHREEKAALVRGRVRVRVRVRVGVGMRVRARVGANQR